MLPAYHVPCTGLPLRAYRKQRVCKLFFVDVGLALYLSGVEWGDLKASEVKLLNRGNISEQFIAQHLAYSQQGLEAPELHYWLREGKSTNAEVDFVIASKGSVLPVEVKAGKAGSLRSLHQFIAHHSVTQAIRFDASLPTTQPIDTQVSTSSDNQRIQFDLKSYPAYSVESVMQSW